MASYPRIHCFFLFFRWGFRGDQRPLKGQKQHIDAYSVYPVHCQGGVRTHTREEVQTVYNEVERV